nr:seroin 2 [Ephestia kuehniella]
MTKIAILLLLVAACQGFPTDSNANLASLAARGDWEAVHRLINERFGRQDIWAPAAASGGNVKSLKPVPGGEVYGEAEYTFHSSSNVNGKTMETSGGHKIINNNGRIEEFDFQPKY